MTNYIHDDEAGARRLDAYVRFLLDAYETDVDGLAKVAGVDRAAMRRFMKAEYADKSSVTLIHLARVTGISVSWLFAESEV